MKSYTDFLLERAFSPAGQAAREKMRAQAGLNAARKASQNAADKGSAIVRTKQGGTSKEAIGAPKQKGQQGVIQPSAIQKYKHPSVPDEKQSGKQPGTTKNDKVRKPKEKGYLGKVKDAAGEQLQKNTENTFGAKSVGKKLGDMPGNTAKSIGKTAGKTFSSLMKQRKPNAESGNQSVETSSHSGQIS